MSFSLYQNKNSYYLITQRGNCYNIAIEFGTFNNKIISNEDLSSYEEIELTSDNIIKLFSSINKLDIIDINDFNNFKYNKCIGFNGSFYYINNWRDIFNLTIGKI